MAMNFVNALVNSPRQPQPAVASRSVPEYKFIVICTPKNGKSFKGTKVSKIGDEIRMKWGTAALPDIRILANGNARISFQKMEDAQLATSIKTLGNLNVEVSLSEHNQTDRVIVYNIPKDYSDEEIITNLKLGGYNPLAIYQYPVRQGKNIRTIQITFKKNETPQGVIYMLYERRPVHPYIPKVKRCTKCQRIGHVEKFCRSEAICGKCGNSHNTKDCRASQLKCVNCRGNHGADSPKCPKYLSTKSVLNMQYTHGISHKEATAHIVNKTTPKKIEAQITPPNKEEQTKESRQFTPTFKNIKEFVNFCTDLAKLGTIKDEEERNTAIGKSILNHVTNSAKLIQITQTTKNKEKPSQAEKTPAKSNMPPPPGSKPRDRSRSRSHSRQTPAKRNIDLVVTEEEDNTLRHGTNPMITEAEIHNQNKRTCSVSSREDAL
ncbi:hypothetical protein SNE40_018202 [Patella caerulea]|uniref:Gag-like protein n=2 Tax=Patella caerulea TaxID=87958 RepID=A0AAN8J9Y8_PATCE